MNEEIPDDALRVEFAFDDNEGWSLADTRASMARERFDPEKVADFQFGPFDARKLYLDNRLVFRPRRRVTNLLLVENLALIANKISRDDDTTFVSVMPVGHKAASRYDPNYVFPLFCFNDDEKKSGALVENFQPKFRSFLGSRYENHYSPEEVFGYLYAVLHAPSYRARYAEFLRIDFPRIPFPESADDFERLSGLGWALAQAHLLRDLPRRGLAAFSGRGKHEVDAVRYAPAEQAIHINKTQCFASVPDAVWNFHIGGYQVLDKYLKSRKGRILSLDEIDHVSAIADSLAFTIDQMTNIDAAYRAAFPDRG